VDPHEFCPYHQHFNGMVERPTHDEDEVQAGIGVDRISMLPSVMDQQVLRPEGGVRKFSEHLVMLS
jgi:hypothetical protein